MPRNKAETISAIRVGIGFDTDEAKKNIDTFAKESSRTIDITPRLIVPTSTDTNAWLRNIETAVNEHKNRKGVRVPIEFDKTAAKAQFDAAWEHVNRSVQPIVVPIEWDFPDAPGGGGGGRGPRGGGTPPESGGGGSTRGRTRTPPPEPEPEPEPQPAPRRGRGRGRATPPPEPAAPAEPPETPPPRTRGGRGQRAQNVVEPVASGPAGAPVSTPPPRPATAPRASSRAEAQQDALANLTNQLRTAQENLQELRREAEAVRQEQAQQPAPEQTRNRRSRTASGGQASTTPPQSIDFDYSPLWEGFRGRPEELREHILGRARGTMVPETPADKINAQIESVNAQIAAAEDSGAGQRLIDRLEAKARDLEAERDRIREGGRAPRNPDLVAADARKEQDLWRALGFLSISTNSSGPAAQAAGDKAFEILEGIAPGLGAAFSEGSPGKMLDTWVRASETTTRGRNRRDKRITGMFSDTTRSGHEQNMAEYPMDFALATLTQAMFPDYSTKKRGGRDAVSGGSTLSARTFGAGDEERSRAHTVRRAELSVRDANKILSEAPRREQELELERQKWTRERGSELKTSLDEVEKRQKTLEEALMSADGAEATRLSTAIVQNLKERDRLQAERAPYAALEAEEKQLQRDKRSAARTIETRSAAAVDARILRERPDQPQVDMSGLLSRTEPTFAMSEPKVEVPVDEEAQKAMQAQALWQAQHYEALAERRQKKEEGMSDADIFALLANKFPLLGVDPERGIPARRDPANLMGLQGGGLMRRKSALVGEVIEGSSDAEVRAREAAGLRGAEAFDRTQQRARDETFLAELGDPRGRLSEDARVLLDADWNSGGRGWPDGMSADTDRILRDLEGRVGDDRVREAEAELQAWYDANEGWTAAGKPVKGMQGGGPLMQRMLQRKIQAAYDAGNYDEGQALNRQLEEMRGGWTTPSALSDLPAVAEHAVSVTKVGEQGPEVIVEQKDGSQFVVPNHQLSAFRKLTGMQGGGWTPEAEAYRSRRVGASMPLPPPDERGDSYGAFRRMRRSSPNLFAQPRVNGQFGPLVFTGDPLQMLDPGPIRPTTQRSQRGSDWMFPPSRGRFSFRGRGGQEIRENQQGGTIPGHGEIQRVYVVNMPGGGGMGGGGGTPGAQRVSGVQPAQTPAQQVPGGAPTVGPTPSTRVRAVRVPPAALSPADKTTALFEGRDAILGFEDRMTQVEHSISESMQMSPVRALSVSVGQIFQNKIGGRSGILQRAREAMKAKQRASGAIAELGRAEQGIFEQTRTIEALEAIEARSGLSPRQETQLETARESLEEQRERKRIAMPRAEQLSQEAEEAAKGVVGPAGIARNIGAGTVGIVGGTLLFTFAMNMAQEGLQQVGKVAADLADKLVGFGMTTNRVSEELSASVRERSGDVRGAIAQQASQLAISPSTNLSDISGFSGRMSAAQIMQEQISLLRAQRNVANREGRGVPGLGTGFGNGPFGFAGPLLNWIGQTPGLGQQVGENLRDMTPRSPVPGFEGTRQSFLSGPATQQAKDEWFAENKPDAFRTAELEFVTAEKDKPWREAAEKLAVQMATEAVETAQESRRGAIAAIDADLERQNELVERAARFNQQTFTGQMVRVAPGDERLSQTRASLTSDVVGMDPAIAEMFENASVAFVDGAGEAMQPAHINRFFELLAEGMITPNLESAMLSMTSRQVPAQMRSIERQVDLQRDLTTAGAFENLIASPFPTRAGTGITAPGVSMASQGAGNRMPQLRQAREALSAEVAAGEQILLGLGVPMEAIESVRTLGQEITDLKSEAEDLQLGLEQREYNNQLRISTRTLGDLVGLNGKQAQAVDGLNIAATRYGQMQRAQIMDARELSRIQLARSQRELNMALALARLRSPGETAAERAVRRREAEMQAREQQKELNIGKRTTRRGFAIQDIEMGRQLTDAVEQFKLMRQARSVNIEVRGIQRVTEAKEQMLQLRRAMLGSARDHGVALRQAGDQIIAEMETRFGEMTDTQIEALRRYLTGVDKEFDGLSYKPTAKPYNAGQARTRGEAMKQRQQEKDGGRTSASGFVGSVLGATSMTMGEAGSEMVAILRNPRPVSMGASGYAGNRGGGIMNVEININGDVKNEADEDRLVKKVVSALHREAAVMSVG